MTLPSFVDDTVIKTGKKKSVVYEGLDRDNNICSEAKEAIKAKQIPKTQANKIAKLSQDDQKRIEEKINIIILFHSFYFSFLKTLV